MLVQDFFDSAPLFDRLRSKGLLALRTQVFHFGVLAVAALAVVVEKDKYFEVRGKLFAFVLANVLRTQLHLACFDVVALLDEACVEHDAAEGGV